MATTKRKIALMGEPVEYEAAAVEAITPGHLLLHNGSGVVKNTANNANVSRLFALEKSESGGDVDEVYAIGDQVKIGCFHAGQRVAAFIPSGQVIAVGDYLTGDAYGRLVAASSNPRLARALEATSPTVDTRISVEIV